MKTKAHYVRTAAKFKRWQERQQEWVKYDMEQKRLKRESQGCGPGVGISLPIMGAMISMT